MNVRKHNSHSPLHPLSSTRSKVNLPLGRELRYLLKCDDFVMYVCGAGAVFGFSLRVFRKPFEVKFSFYSVSVFRYFILFPSFQKKNRNERTGERNWALSAISRFRPPSFEYKQRKTRKRFGDQSHLGDWSVIVLGHSVDRCRGNLVNYMIWEKKEKMSCRCFRRRAVFGGWLERGTGHTRNTHFFPAGVSIRTFTLPPTHSKRKSIVNWYVW